MEETKRKEIDKIENADENVNEEPKEEQVQEHDGPTAEQIQERVTALYHKMKDEFMESEAGREVIQRAKNIVEPVLEEWAHASIQYKLGPEEDREANRDIIKMSDQTVGSVMRGAKAYMKNYALKKLGSILNRIIVKYILPIVA